jgi:23S rRNA (pseudouridine1915-N3)-methyltransferase
MTVNIICVGKIKEDYFVKATAEFEKRLSRFCTFNVICLPDKSIPENASPAEEQIVLKKEGEEILKKIGKGDIVIAMCIEGKQLSSEELSEKIEQIQSAGNSEIVFIIGSSFGLSPEVKARADYKLSISKLTFPHQLLRVILHEAVYRALSIINGTKYHK